MSSSRSNLTYPHDTHASVRLRSRSDCCAYWFHRSNLWRFWLSINNPIFFAAAERKIEKRRSEMFVCRTHKGGFFVWYRYHKERERDRERERERVEQILQKTFLLLSKCFDFTAALSSVSCPLALFVRFFEGFQKKLVEASIGQTLLGISCEKIFSLLTSIIFRP